MKKIFFALTLACALTIPALAHDGKKHDHKQDSKAKATQTKGGFLGKGDGVESCPVTGEPILNQDTKGDFYGRTIYFCCAGCLTKAQKNPAAYIKKTQAEQVAATKNVAKPAAHDHGAHHAQEAAKSETKFLGKGDGIETCPVTGEAVNKNLKGEALGRTFYVCCEGCLETVKKNPDLYLKKESGAKKETAFLGKGDGIETCPVTGTPVNKDLKGEANGQTFYVCCAGCIETVKANPDAYLKKTGNK